MSCAFRLRKLAQNACRGIRVRHFHWKFPHKMPLVTCPFAFRLLAARYACGICNIPHKMPLVHMSMCISTAQARTKCLPGDTRTVFSLYISTQDAACDMSMCISCAQARKKCLPRDTRTVFSLYISAQNAACDMSMCISTAQARRKCLPRDTRPAVPLVTCPCAFLLGSYIFPSLLPFVKCPKTSPLNYTWQKNGDPGVLDSFKCQEAFFLGSLHRDLVKTPLVPQTVWPHWRVLTVTVKARCSIEVASEASGIFPVNFRTKCLLWHVHVHFDCASSRKMLAAGYAYGISLKISAQNASGDMSMCISTAQARAKCLPRDTRTAFSLKISAQNASGDMSMCISTAQARTRCALPGLGIGLPPQHHPPQHHHLPPPPPQHSHQHLLIIIIIIIIIIILIIIINIVINSSIIINMIIQFPFTSHTLWGLLPG